MSAIAPTAARAESPSRKKTGQRRPAPLIEFTAAAHEHIEPAFDFTVTPGAAIADHGPFDVPAYGFMRHILLLISTSGGVAGPGVLAADAPWNLFSEVTLLDVNGAPIYGPFTGYQLYLTNFFGGYAFTSDPALDPDADVTSVVAFTYALRIPVEIQHNNGLGALANQNSAAAYKVRLRTNPSTTIWSTAPTTVPAVRVRGRLEAWSQPNPTDLLGRPQATRPPRHGTTQYWSVNTKSLATGAQTPKVDRVGNLIRQIILVNRLQSTGARDTASFPDPIEVRWDQRQFTTEDRFIRRKLMRERLGQLAAAGIPAGVFVFDYSHDVLGKAGDGTPEMWIPTVQATRFEFNGSFGAAVNLEMLINDVAPVETDPTERYVEGSETGFTPEVGVPLRGAA